MKRIRWSRLVRRTAKQPLRIYNELPTRIGDALRHLGCGAIAEALLYRVHCAQPYDLGLAEHLADFAYRRREHRYAPGTPERSEFLLRILDRAFPSPRVTAAYFENLEAYLAARAPGAEPGRVVLGLGSGRCGSTSLAEILRRVPRAIATHEIAPYVNWDPLPCQIDFHLRRFALLRRFFPLVGDCAHWWLRAVEQVFAAIPDSLAFGLVRDEADCVRSWMAVSPPDVNHWVAPHNHIWPADKWDPLYPHYELPPDARRDPAHAKAQLIHRYVREYNERLTALADRYAGRILLLRTEQLDRAETRHEIGRFLGHAVEFETVRLNERRDDVEVGERLPPLPFR
jgi:hypothetical protein